MVINLLSKYMDKTEKKLLSLGVKYMFPQISASVYLLMRVLVVVFIILILTVLNVHIFLITVACIAGFELLYFLIKLSNKADNDDMMADIECIYDIIRIQARAGVYIRDSLMDCYVSTVNKRLKSALLELCNQTSTNKTMDEAVREFNSKFCNRHIDVLCIVLSQAQSSGKTVQILSDMSEQINQLRHLRAKCDEGRLERKIEVIELLIFVGILAIGIFAMSNEIAGMINF